MSKPREKKIAYELKQFAAKLNPEQQTAQETIIASAITVLFGKAGSGKTLTATYAALQQLHNKVVDKIVITRPTVSDEQLGFLPGTVGEKMDPWLSPIYANLDLLIGRIEREKLLVTGQLEIVPLAYMRGRTFLKSIIIADEIQNITHKQMEMILTRLGKGSQMILCGDMRQTDLPRSSNSGLPFLLSLENRVPSLNFIELQTNHRHAVVDHILELYQMWEAPLKPIVVERRQTADI